METGSHEGLECTFVSHDGVRGGGARSRGIFPNCGPTARGVYARHNDEDGSQCHGSAPRRCAAGRTSPARARVPSDRNSTGSGIIDDAAQPFAGSQSKPFVRWQIAAHAYGKLVITHSATATVAVVSNLGTVSDLAIGPRAAAVVGKVSAVVKQP